jgi:hypothetical protein
MEYGVPNYADVEFWRLRARQSAADLESGGLPGQFQQTAPEWQPLFRYHGGILYSVIEGSDELAATIAIFSSAEGLAEFRAESTIQTLIAGQAELIARVTGPVTDTFSHGPNANSGLRALEISGNALALDTDLARFMAICRWRIRTEAGPLANGVDLRLIPQGRRYQPYLQSILAQIVNRLGQSPMLGGWTVDTGDDTLTSVGIFPTEESLRAALETLLEPDSQRSRAYPHLELTDSIAGPAIDLLRLGAGEYGTDGAVSPSP